MGSAGIGRWLVLLIAAVGLGGCTDREAPLTKAENRASETLRGKVLVGYQGWYRTPTDGSGLGWKHYETYEETFEPGACGIDAWPDVGELDRDEKYATSFRHADGSTAEVFTSENPKTVARHFQWMKEYGIDGAVLQRFAHDVLPGGHHQWELLQPSNNRVLGNVKQAANQHGRSYMIMYDLTGVRHGEMPQVMEDWRGLNRNFDLLHDACYQHHSGKPVVAIWGVGFGDNRAYTLEEIGTLMDFFQNDPDFGGCTVVLGIPTFWREQVRDSTKDPEFHKLLGKADVLCPWTIGRYETPEQARKHTDEVAVADIAWCLERGIDYLPVAFPGFSWANRYAHENAPFDKIPRLGGRFFWSQATGYRKAGAEMLYVAMFDEMDEATQIFKVTDNPPVGASRFLSYNPDPSDHYLWLTGQAGRLMRGELQANLDLPARIPDL
ncbi:MAG: xylosidase/arabinosidase [Bdellovibrionaceae bacterium]|nr:xylosidase/arabinosidase [Pseudobdellovibrionaceae bacterium]